MKILKPSPLLILFCLCTLFVNLDSQFPDLMEMRNFISAREMISHGNWWNTTLNLEPRLEKPPLPTWITAFTIWFFKTDQNLFTLRLPSALVACLMVYFLFQYVQLTSRKTNMAYVASFILASSLLFIMQARINSWDIYSHAFLMGSIWQFLVAIQKNRLIALVWSALLMSASILSKGPVGLYALWLPFLIAYANSERKESLKKYWKQLVFITLLGLMIGFSWRFLVSIYSPEVSEQVLTKEINSWTEKHTRPFYFYIHFPIFIGIWLPFLVAGLIPPYAKRLFKLQDANYRFTIQWLLFGFFLLSIIPTKKERYLLPLVIPMAILTSHIIYGLYIKWKESILSNWDKILIGVFSILLFSSSIIQLVYLSSQTKYELSLTALIFSILISLLGVAGVFYWRRFALKHLFSISVLIVSFFYIGLYPFALELSYNNPDRIALDEIRNDDRVKKNKVYFFGDEIDPRIVWLIGKDVGYYSEDLLTDRSNYPLVVLSFWNIENAIKKAAPFPVEYERLGIFDIRASEAPWKIEPYYVYLEE